MPTYVISNEAEDRPSTWKCTARVIYYTKLVKNNKVLSDNVYYFVPTKNMELPEPGIRTNITAASRALQIRSLTHIYKH